MALLHNTYLRSALLGRFQGSLGNSLPGAGMVRQEKENWFNGDHAPSKRSNFVEGCLPPQAWSMPIKAGAMASRNSANISFTTTAVGQAIFNMTGTASWTFNASALFLEAIFPGYGSASITFSTNTPALTGTGFMTGTTVESGVVTNSSIAAAVIAAAASTPIAANIKQVNDTTVHGNGQAGSEWGP